MGVKKRPRSPGAYKSAKDASTSTWKYSEARSFIRGLSRSSIAVALSEVVLGAGHGGQHRVEPVAFGIGWAAIADGDQHAVHEAAKIKWQVATVAT
jgi:hypothetical protein